MELSPRQKEIFILFSQGHTRNEIAKMLFLSPETVKSHVRISLLKNNKRNATHLISDAIREGIL